MLQQGYTRLIRQTEDYIFSRKCRGASSRHHRTPSHARAPPPSHDAHGRRNRRCRQLLPPLSPPLSCACVRAPGPSLPHASHTVN
jgi:hypothetical protein